jgi:hypothetical protein
MRELIGGRAESNGSSVQPDYVGIFLYNLEYSGMLHGGAGGRAESNGSLLQLIQSTDSGIIWDILEGLAGGRAESNGSLLQLIQSTDSVIIWNILVCCMQGLEGELSLMALCSNLFSPQILV